MNDNLLIYLLIILNFNLEKYLVIALLEEYKVRGKLASIQHEEFHDLIRSIAYSYETDNKFIFGWTSEIDTINSIAIKTFTSLPNLIIINSTNLQYFILEDELLSQNIINLLDEIKYESLNIKVMFITIENLFYIVVFTTGFRW